MPVSSHAIAHSIGRALAPLRPGVGKLAMRRPPLDRHPASIAVESQAFANGGVIPERYTIWGANLSPPLSWSNLPAGAHSVVLLVEDADAPFPRPLVHALLLGMSPDATALGEGAIPPSLRGSTAPGGALAGRNSIGRQGWLPISPPPGHGPHRYAFQVFALDAVPRFDWPPGRSHALRIIAPHVIATGSLVGIYQRR